MIAVIDYGLGNLGSIINMLSFIGAESQIISDPDQLQKAEKLILPGVGAFDAGMTNLKERGWLAPLNQDVLVNRKPILGICLGMQLLTESSEEGKLPGLGWIRGRMTKTYATIRIGTQDSSYGLDRSEGRENFRPFRRRR